MVPIIAKGSKIGMHSIYPGQVIPLMHAAHDRNTSWALVKGVDNGGIAIDAKKIDPRTLTITRFVNEAEDSAQGVDKWSLADMRQHAQAAVGAIVDRLNSEERGAADWLEPINEADPPGVAGWKAFGQYLCEMVREADRRGVKIALPALNSGTPEWDEMQALAGTGLFGLMKSGGHILTAHEGIVRDKPVDIGFGELIPGAPSVPGAGSICCRYRYLYSILQARNEVVPLVISEFYGGGSYSLPPAEQVARFTWYDREIRKDPYVLAALPFTIDPPATKWQDQNYTYAYPAVLDYIVQERDVPNAVDMPIPGPVVTPPGSDLWPRGVCLVGLHGRADGRNQPADMTAIGVSRVEAVKLMSSATPEEAAGLIAANKFVMVRLFEDFHNRTISSADFLSWQIPVVRAYSAAGVKYFEIHNEPNLYDEGLGKSWMNGTGFGQWFAEVYRGLKAAFPSLQFGFPGLSPGPDDDNHQIRMDSTVFLSDALAAAKMADWIGIHCYWVSDAEMLSEAGGLGYQIYMRQFPDKLLFITECANAFDGPAPRGAQYVNYYKKIRFARNVGAAFAFVVSAQNQDFRFQSWRSEQGVLSDIPGIVGAAMPGIQSMPRPAQEDAMSNQDRAEVKDVANNLRALATRLDAVAAAKHTLSGLTNNNVFSLFQKAFGTNYYSLVVQALDEAAMLADRTGPYKGPAIEDMTALTEAQRKLLIAALPL